MCHVKKIEKKYTLLIEINFITFLIFLYGDNFFLARYSFYGGIENLSLSVSPLFLPLQERSKKEKVSMNASLARALMGGVH